MMIRLRLLTMFAVLLPVLVFGQLHFPNYLHVRQGSALDTRFVAEKKADLLDEEWPYVGMLVAVINDGDDNGLWMLTDDDPTIVANWTKLGSGRGNGDFMADGSVPMTGNLDAGSQEIINVTAMTLGGDRRTTWPEDGVQTELDPVFTTWLETNAYVKVETDPEWTASDLYANDGSSLTNLALIEGANITIVQSDAGATISAALDATTNAYHYWTKDGDTNVFVTTDGDVVYRQLFGTGELPESGLSPVFVSAEEDPVFTNWLAGADFLTEETYLGDFKADGSVPMTGNLDVDGNEIANVTAMTLGGERRETWPEGGGGDVAWGDITGTLLDQLDLTNTVALAASAVQGTPWLDAYVESTGLTPGATVTIAHDDGAYLYIELTENTEIAFDLLSYQTNGVSSVTLGVRRNGHDLTLDATTIDDPTEVDLDAADPLDLIFYRGWHQPKFTVR